MKDFDPKYNDIPKTEIHIHLEGAIRTQTIIDVAKEYNLQLPSYEVSELDKHVKVYDQMRDLETVLKAFDIFQRSIASPEIVERIAWELFEDSAKQNIKLSEIRFSPIEIENYLPFPKQILPRGRPFVIECKLIPHLTELARQLNLHAHFGIGAFLGDIQRPEECTGQSAANVRRCIAAQRG